MGTVPERGLSLNGDCPLCYARVYRYRGLSLVPVRADYVTLNVRFSDGRALELYV
jgi:hypothetical protein